MNEQSRARHVLTMNQLKASIVSNDDFVARIFTFRARAYLEAFDLLDLTVNARNEFREHATHDWFRSICGHYSLLAHRPLVRVLSEAWA